MAHAELPSEMKAQFLDSFNTPYVFRSTSLPTLSSRHDMLIKVDAASYCHTDAVLAGAQHGSLRVTATRGAGPRGLAPPVEPKPSILVTLAPLRSQALFAPLKLHPTGIRRNDTSPISRAQSGPCPSSAACRERPLGEGGR